MVKECREEASIPEDLARNAKPVGAVSYEEVQDRGLKRDVLFCYDLKLPVDFVPEPQAGGISICTLLLYTATYHTCCLCCRSAVHYKHIVLCMIRMEKWSHSRGFPLKRWQIS